MFNLGKAISRVIDLFTNLGAIFVIVMMVHIAVDVILRYFFQSAVEGTIEIVSNYYMVIIGYLSLCFTEEKNRNISVEPITDQMPKWLQRHFEALSYLFASVVFSLLTVRTFLEAMKKHAVGTFVTQGTANVPIWPAYYFIPLGCALVLIVVLYKLVCYATGSESGLNERLDDAEPDFQSGAQSRPISRLALPASSFSSSSLRFASRSASRSLPFPSADCGR